MLDTENYLNKRSSADAVKPARHV